MEILFGCEESQECTKAFRAKGHNAYSNDILPCSGDRPDWHITGDFLDVVKSKKFDLVISFPPCTDLAVSGARWFAEKRANGSQRKAIIFFLNVWRHSNAVENPIGIMNKGTYVKKWFPELYLYGQKIGFPWQTPDIIHPWQFGHGETKSTCLWLRGLPSLIPTNIVEGREGRVWKMPPSADRAKLRSKTYSGIAEAMAEQWSNYDL